MRFHVTNDDSGSLRIAVLLITWGEPQIPPLGLKPLGRDDSFRKVRIGCAPQGSFRLSPYRYFAAWARSSGVICCQMRSRFCFAQSLFGLAASAELSQR